MKRGDERQVRMCGGELWTCVIQSSSMKSAHYLVRWKTGPLAGREARLSKEFLESHRRAS